MLEPDPVLLDVTAEGVAIVTLNRPQRRNAFDEQMIAGLSDTFETLRVSDTVRLVVLKGAGGVFCAGADLEWMRRQGRHSHEENVADARALADMLHRLAELPQLTVALVQGGAWGGGLGLMAACDMAFAVAGCSFSFSEVRLGLTPATISPYVVAAIGPREAKALFATGQTFDSAWALRIGLLRDVVEDETALAGVEEWVARMMLSAAPGAVADAKALVNHVAAHPNDASLRAETARQIATRRASPEGREGLAAFLERRKPGWVTS
jgi:methylglutaconyl-CoA hydratase